MDNTTTFILVGSIFSSNNSSADALRSTEIAGGWQSTSLRHSLDFIQYVYDHLTSIADPYHLFETEPEATAGRSTHSR